MSGAPEAHANDQPMGSRVVDVAIPVCLLLGAAAGWWWAAQMAGDMGSMGTDAPGMGAMTSMSPGDSISMGAYVVGWVAMMAAMMFPAITPMVRMYARAAATGNVAPVPFFVAGYMCVWGAMAVPSYFAWRGLAGPLSDGAPWVGRLAAAVLLAAAIYQLTPLKSACLKHCRSPISFFIRHAGTSTNTPYRAARLGVHHGAFCLGCCWAIMAVLVAFGTMHLGWMVLLSLVILAEKLAPRGEQLAAAVAVGFAVLAVVLLLEPTTITTIT